MMMKQLALDIGLATGPTLARFFAGPNEAALQHLRLAAGEPAVCQGRTDDGAGISCLRG